MKVLIVTGEPFPNGMAATRRIECYGRAIMEAGAECEVLIFKRTEVHGKPAKNILGYGTYNNVKFRYSGGTPQRGGSIFLRWIEDCHDAANAENYIRKTLQERDVLFIYMGAYVKLMLKFIKAAKEKGAYCIRDLCELPYGTGEESKINIHMRNIVLSKQFPKFDGVISISDALMNLAKCYTSTSCRHIKVPVLVDYEAFCPIHEDNGTEMPPFIFHAGTLSEQKDGFLGLLEAFGKACTMIQADVKLISTGSFVSSRQSVAINNMINDYGLQGKVIFTGYLPDTEMKKYLSQAALVVSNKYDTQQNHFCFSTKLAECTASGKPIVLTTVGEAMNYFQKGVSAVTVPPGDADSLSRAIVYAFNNPLKLRELAINGQLMCRHNFDYRIWGEPLKDFLNSLGE